MPEELNSYSPKPRLHVGAAYYPEHWPEERWADDIRMMHEAGLTVARLAEFAWSTLEPAPGEFHFDWLENVIDRLAAEGIDSVLGTPTAAPPAWLIQQHPDILPVEENGRRMQFGNRCHYCPNSPDMQAAAERIVRAMAERFGSNPHVLGWQTDNELGRVCYCDRCQALFRRFLRDRYGTLENLNNHWSTAYWSQTYSDWDQIPLPVGPHNPGLMLEFKHFVTESNRKFQKLQVDLLRPCLHPGAWITHNFMGWYDGFDHYKMSEDLDLASWDDYVGTGRHDPAGQAAAHDLTRGFKRRNFWVMETQPGHVNWSPVNNSLDKGEARLMAWAALAHGADAVLYWQWRSALGGQEQYHGSLVDPSGRARPFYVEVQQVAREFDRLSPLLAGSIVKSRVAMLNDYDSRWSIQWQRHHRDFDYVAHLKHYYYPLFANNIPIDILSADAPLKGYRLVIAPALLILNEQRLNNFKEYVNLGGHLVLTARTGMKDEWNALLPSRQPGPLGELAGIEVVDYYALDEEAPVIGNWFNGYGHTWAETLQITDYKFTQIIARYGKSNGWLDGQPAITVGAFGSGLVYYVGTYLDDAAQKAVMERFANTAGLRSMMPTPPGVEACKRVKENGEEVIILLNHLRAEQVVSLPWTVRERLNGNTYEKELRLEPYGVAVLTRP
ncbi:MAG: beta-galactosidase [Omnitrophica WOR_2 bacterium]